MSMINLWALLKTDGSIIRLDAGDIVESGPHCGRRIEVSDPCGVRALVSGDRRGR